MIRRKTLELLETKIGNCEVTPQALWPVTKSLIERDKPKSPIIIHGPLGITYHPNEKAKMISDSLENRFTSHYLCDENHERQEKIRVQAVFAFVDDAPLKKNKTL
jgi:hypothetical protein